jgi:hypothetical protein
LKLGHIITNAANGSEELWGSLSGGGGEFLRCNAKRFRGEFAAIQFCCVMQHRRQPLLANIFADAAHDFAGAEGFAEEFDRSLSAGFRNHIATGTELFAELA